MLRTASFAAAAVVETTVFVGSDHSTGVHIPRARLDRWAPMRGDQHEPPRAWRNRPHPNWLVDYQMEGIDPSRRCYSGTESKVSPEPSGTRGAQRATEFGCSVRGGPVARTAEHKEVPWRRSVPPGPIRRRDPRVAGDSGGWHSHHVRLREQGRPRPVRRLILR